MSSSNSCSLSPPYVPGLRILGMRWHPLLSPIRRWVQPAVFLEFCQIQEDLRAHELRAAQVRARTQWVEEGEVSSSYFFSLENKHQRKKAMSGIIEPSSGTVQHNPLEILAIWRSYSELFFAEPCDSAVQSELLTQLECTLSEEECSSCEGLLILPRNVNWLCRECPLAKLLVPMVSPWNSITPFGAS